MATEVVHALPLLLVQAVHVLLMLFWKRPFF
jgi:hypothetical protein